LVRAIIFDFDGVIVESADVKTEAFKELFLDYPTKINDVLEYHLSNAGLSRYVKFRHIYEKILGKKLSKDNEAYLGKHFSQLVFQKVINAPFVAGAKEFLRKFDSRYRFFIASGTPEEELRNIVYLRDLQGYFDEIHGSPKEKTNIINDIIKNYDFARNEVIYIGDAQSDQIAAERAGIAFIERKKDLTSKLNGDFRTIKDLTNLEKILAGVF